jgi:hypothetical protein
VIGIPTIFAELREIQSIAWAAQKLKETPFAKLPAFVTITNTLRLVRKRSS